MISNRMLNIWLIFLAVLVLMVAQVVASGFVHAADRAVEIAKQSRDRIESSGNLLKSSSKEMFSEFAERTAELQKLLNAREHLEKAGLLDKTDPDGRARRANINARILMEVGKLKEVCDHNIEPLLSSLESFDRAIAESIVDTQATRSINDNHELSLKTYRETESERFNKAAQDAEELLNDIRSEDDPVMKKRLEAKFKRVKNRLRSINQRRVLYESRIKIAAMNQKLSDKTRIKIREHGEAIPAKFVNVISSLYNVFYKLVPIAETGGTGFVDGYADIGFSNLKQLSETLDIVEDSTAKLNIVIDGMVNDVLEDLDGIKRVDGDTISTGDNISYEKEMEYIQKAKAAWGEG